jgi:hypothetical protein
MSIDEFYEAERSAKEIHVYFDEAGRRKLYGGEFTGGDESTRRNPSTTEEQEQ